ncbi:MAG: hypothetical protein IPF84_13215 [Proteobacteria bacterium]|nr:hypothetical protein [Pseudomonadota bacterium]
MARKRPSRTDGTVVVLEHRSKILADNPLGDPAERKLGDSCRTNTTAMPRTVAAGDSRCSTTSSGSRAPALRTSTGNRSARTWPNARRGSCTNASAWARRSSCSGLLHVARRQPVRELVGHRQLRGLPAREIIPFVDRKFRTLASREHRGCFGKSSGGYGAIIHGMKYASHWGPIANHSGDACFDFVYRADWPNTLNELGRLPPPTTQGRALCELRRFGRRPQGWRRAGRRRCAASSTQVWKKAKLTTGEGHALMNVCMAATYDPDPDVPNGFRLPFHLETGELLPQRWRRWLQHDPGRLVGKYAANLRRLEGIYIDCGLARPIPSITAPGNCHEPTEARASRTTTRSSTTPTRTSTTAWT